MRTTYALLASVLLATAAAACTEPLDEPLDESTDVEAKNAANNPGVDVPPAVEPVACGAGKVLVCHIPPGNPENAHDICISDSAVETHIQQHGDNVGACATRTVAPPPPVCVPFGADCTVNEQCCSNACSWGECIDQI